MRDIRISKPFCSKNARNSNEGGVFFMVFVKKQPGDSNDSIIRKFQKKFQQGGGMWEMKKREFGGKPSAIRKFRKELARKMAKQMQQRAAN